MTTKIRSKVQPVGFIEKGNKEEKLDRAQAIVRSLHEKCDPSKKALRMLTIMLLLASLVWVSCSGVVTADVDDTFFEWTTPEVVENVGTI